MVKSDKSDKFPLTLNVANLSWNGSAWFLVLLQNHCCKQKQRATQHSGKKSGLQQTGTGLNKKKIKAG